MSIYRADGACWAICADCDYSVRLEWKAGDGPVFMPSHHGQTMLQLTHNDGETPLWERKCGLRQACCALD